MNPDLTEKYFSNLWLPQKIRNTEIKGFRPSGFLVVLRSRPAYSPSYLTPVLLPTCYLPNIISYWYKVLKKTSGLRNVLLLKHRASKTSCSKNVMLPKRPSYQSKTSANCGQAVYSAHSSLTMNYSTTSYFETSDRYDRPRLDHKKDARPFF